MRLILMFDLPTDDEEDRKIYTKFRKNLLKLGFVMIQYSIYAKCVNDVQKVQQEVFRIQKIIPLKGNIRVLAVTEKQYQSMYILRGQRKINEIYNDERRYIKI